MQVNGFFKHIIGHFWCLNGVLFVKVAACCVIQCIQSVLAENKPPSFVNVPWVLELNMTESTMKLVVNDDKDTMATITMVINTTLPDTDYTFGMCNNLVVCPYLSQLWLVNDLVCLVRTEEIANKALPHSHTHRHTYI